MALRPCIHLTDKYHNGKRGLQRGLTRLGVAKGGREAGNERATGGDYVYVLLCLSTKQSFFAPRRDERKREKQKSSGSSSQKKKGGGGGRSAPALTRQPTTPKPVDSARRP